MKVYRFRFSHFAFCAVVVALGAYIGQSVFIKYGSFIDGTNRISGDFLSAFTDGFFITLCPMLLVFCLSFTVYALPAAATALCFQCVQDTYFILSAWDFLTHTGEGAYLPCGFFIAARGFFTYSYLLLTMRTMCYRSKVRLLPSTLETVFRPGSRRFFRDYATLAGIACLAGLFTHTVFYFS